MSASDGPGQQAIPRAIKAIPATRATGNAGKLLTEKQLPDQ